MKGRILRTVLSAFIAGATTLSSMPVSAFAETGTRKNANIDNVHIDEHDHDHGCEEEHDHCCEEEHDHCCEDEELFLGNGINVAVLDGGITNYESAKEVSFVDDNEFSEHGNMMADILMNEVPEIAVYDVRVLDSEGKGKYSDISEAIVWSVNNDADIIVMSFEGYEASTLLEDAVKYAAENDVLMIAAAGNNTDEGTIYPAAYPTVISSGVIDESGETYGGSADIYVEAVGGTSFAAQYVAADAVRYMQENPDMSSEEVRNALTYNKVKNYTGENSTVDGIVYAAACSHYVYQPSYVEKTKATCDKDGEKVLYCSRGCGTILDRKVIPKLTHEWGEWNCPPAAQATCYKQGTKYRNCKRCGDTDTMNYGPLEHKCSWQTETYATCKSVGKEQYKCYNCSKVLNERDIPKLAHEWGEWNCPPSAQATCDKQGTKYRNCKRCGDTDTMNYGPLDHKCSWQTKTPATCTSVGKEQYKCHNCSEVLEERDIKVLGHDIIVTSNAAGLKYEKCTRSGCTYKVDPVKITKQPSSGYFYLGDEAYTKVVATGKDLTYKWELKEPGSEVWGPSKIKYSSYSYTMTSLKDGRKVRCTITDAFGNKVTSQEATLKSKVKIVSEPKDDTGYIGERVKSTVSVSGKNPKYTWYVKDVGEDWVTSGIKTSTYDFNMTKAKNGRQVYCIITDDNKKQAISRIVTFSIPSHTCSFNGSYRTSKPATCTREGEKVGECTKCGKVLTTVTIPKKGHNLVNYTYKPTCTAEGYSYKYCTRTGCKYKTDKTNVVSPLKHSYTEYVKTVKPTCEDKGYDLYKCSRSGCISKTEKNYTAATNMHSYMLTNNNEVVCRTCTSRPIVSYDEYTHLLKESDYEVPGINNEKNTKKAYLVYFTETNDVYNSDMIDTLLKTMESKITYRNNYEKIAEINSFINENKKYINNADEMIQILNYAEIASCMYTIMNTDVGVMNASGAVDCQVNLVNKLTESMGPLSLVYKVQLSGLPKMMETTSKNVADANYNKIIGSLIADEEIQLESYVELFNQDVYDNSVESLYDIWGGKVSENKVKEYLDTYICVGLDKDIKNATGLSLEELIKIYK